MNHPECHSHKISAALSELFPAWFLGRHPDRSIITACYGQELADDFGRQVRNRVSDPVHHAIFTEFRLADDSTSMRRFNTTAGGSYYAVGRGGAITGRGAHLLLIDDPLKDAEEVRSEVTRRGLFEWYASVAFTRLQPGGAVVLISTRWHEDDLAGRLLRQDPKSWVVLSLPAIAEVDETFRRVSDALWPEKYPIKDLEENALLSVAPHGHRCTNSVQPPQRERFSRENGGAFFASSRRLSASFSPGTRHSRPAPRTIFPLALPGAWRTAGITCSGSGAAKSSFPS